MILSRTLEGPPNLNLMTLEPRNASPIYDPVALFEDLKKTPLYNAELQRWVFSMQDSQQQFDVNLYVENQLLDILVTTELRQVSTKNTYEKLKETQFYNKHKQFWRENFVPQEGCGFDVRDTNLLDILILSEFDKELAKDTYTHLEARYHQFYNSTQEFCASNRLLKIFVLSKFDFDTAKESYLKLQDSDMYDRDLKQWNCIKNKQGDSVRHAKDQLLDVLVLSDFNIEEARDVYERLKRTPLYDGKLRQWNLAINAEQVLQNTQRLSFNQLLAVLVESKLAKAFPHETLLTENLPALPDIWRAK